MKKSGTISRRRFIGSCAACSACMAAHPMTGFSSLVSKKKLKLHIIYSLHDEIQPGPDWPNVGFDFLPVINRFNYLLESNCPEFNFIHSLAKGPEEAQKILQEDEKSRIDGYIVFQMNCWNRVVQTIATSAKPVLYMDYKYAGSGGFLVYTAGFLRNEATNVGFVSSSEFNDVVKAVKAFEIIRKGGTVSEFVAATRKARISTTPGPENTEVLPDLPDLLSADECLYRMKESKILAVRNEESGPADPVMHIPLEYLSFAVVNDAWKKADRDEARQIATKWQNRADDVIDVSFDTLQNSAAFYLGMKDVLNRYDANAITINCLGGFYGGHIHAYPCLGFHELNNEGLIGACECDIRSTATMVAFTHMTNGRPGYISDPVMDTAKRQIIYAHCVASNKVFGPGGPENPFSIMTHSEDRQGASVRSVMPVGHMTTTLEADQAKKEILLHQAISRDNDPDDRACRTKLCAEPIGDMEKLFTMWDRWGWHRVTYYGDLKESVYALADEIGWKVVEEA
jgi:hypothetical protein